jgi:hypothetical protein
VSVPTTTGLLSALAAWHRERAPGARWEHNVYTINTTWTRPNRRLVLSRLDRIRGRRHLNVTVFHTERTGRGGSHSRALRSYTATQGHSYTGTAEGRAPPRIELDRVEVDEFDELAEEAEFELAEIEQM